MVTSDLAGSSVKDIVHTFNVLVFLDELILGLTSDLWNQVHAHGKIFLGSEATHIDQNLQVITLEVSHEVFNEDTRQNLLLSHLSLLVGGSLLQNTAVLLFILTGVSSFHSLGFNQLRLTKLFVLGLVLGELLVFPLFDNLNLSLIESLANEDLQNWASLSLEVKDGFSIQLILFVNSIKFWDEDGIWGHIDVEVWLDIKLVHLTGNV